MASGRDCASLKFVVLYLSLSRGTGRRFLFARLPQAKRCAQAAKTKVTTMNFKLLLTIFLLGLTCDTFACKCSGPRTVIESFNSADVVFTGKVIKIRLTSFAETLRTEKANWLRQKIKKENRETQDFDDTLIYKVDLQIVESFKGEVKSDTITIFTTIGGQSCGFDFILNKVFIVYAQVKSYSAGFYLNAYERAENIERANCFWTSRCSRTKEFDTEEVNSLKKLKGKKEASAQQ